MPNSNLRIALLGGEGLRSQSGPLWKALFSLAQIEQPRIAIIPVAFSSLPMSQSERRTQITRNQLNEFGFSTEVVTTTDSAEVLISTQVFYLPGGDQRAVVSSLQDSPLWNEVTVTSGSLKLLIASGGSAVALGDRTFAPIRPYPAALDELEFELLPGLGLLPNLVVLPYFSWLQESVISKILNLAPYSVLLGIDDQAAVVSDTSGWRVMGLGIVTIYRPSQPPSTFDPGSQIPTDVLAPYP